MVKMKKIYKNHEYHKEINKNNEELAFMLWQAELNKELLSFWKSILK